jgi:CBS domain-containing protein
MTPAVKTVTRQVTLRDLEALFEKHDFNAFPVVEAGKMLGIVTKFDFLQAFAFTTSQIVPRFPVIGSDGQLVGMISREDVMRALKETTREDRL